MRLVRLLSSWWKRSPAQLATVVLLLLILGVLLLPFWFGLSQAIGESVFGPPAIWDRPRRPLAAPELAGEYRESSRTVEGLAPQLIRVELHQDGSMRVSHLPERFCNLSGGGRWLSYTDSEEHQRIELQVSLPSGTGSCEPGVYGALSIAGRHPPYRLYWTVGDPDTGEGIWLASNR